MRGTLLCSATSMQLPPAPFHDTGEIFLISSKANGSWGRFRSADIGLFFRYPLWMKCLHRLGKIFHLPIIIMGPVLLENAASVSSFHHVDSRSFRLLDAYNTFDLRACEFLQCLKFLCCFIFKVDLLPFSPFPFLAGGNLQSIPGTSCWHVLISLLNLLDPGEMIAFDSPFCLQLHLV